MPLKKLIRTLHLLLGLTSGVVVMIVAVSGCLYCFEKEFRQIIHADVYNVIPTNKPYHATTDVIACAQKMHPGKPVKSINFPLESDKSVQVQFKDKYVVFVDPYRLEALGGIDMETEFFALVLKLHRNLLLGEPGKLVTGISALIFLVMIISGIVLWWPVNRNALKYALSIKKDASIKRRNLDLHRVLGFYASFILIFSVLTGLIWSFKWVENGMYLMTGSKKEQHKPKSLAVNETKASVDLIRSAALIQFPSKAMFINFPEDSLAAYRVSIIYSEDGLFKKQHQIFFDQYSAIPLKVKLSGQSSSGDLVKSANYNIHTGRAFGFFGQILVFFASAIAASLPVTGFLIWWARQKKQQPKDLSVSLAV